MAKRICRTADRFDPTGVPLPRCCVRRATPPSCTAVVHEISQRDKDAFIFGEGCAGLARRQTGRDHSLPPGPGRAAPPICSDLIYDRHNRLPLTISAIKLREVASYALTNLRQPPLHLGLREVP